MNEKYLITLYEKIKYTDNVILIKKTKTIKDATINYNDEYEEATFYNEDNQRIKLDDMYNPYTFVSDDKFCYGFPMTMGQVKELCPTARTEKEIIDYYNSKIDKVLEFLYYDETKDSVKVICTNEDEFKNVESDELFCNYSLEYDGSEESKIQINTSTLDRMIKMVGKKQYKKLSEQLLSFKEEVDDSINQMKQTYDSTQKVELQEAKEEQVSNDETIGDVLKELDSLVGLDNIKQKVKALFSYLLFKDKTKKYLKLKNKNLNMIFTGNPGTGKTSVARIMAKIFYKLGYIKVDKFEEITASALIAPYVGQTALKTAEFIKKNKGGVIFVDEAYVLASKAQEFADEAIVEILKELDNKETIFIFAGYKDKMEEFIELNPGIYSRVGKKNIFEYKDYTTEELYQILENKLTEIGFEIGDNVKSKVIKILESVKNIKNFGNGRFVDNIIDDIIEKHSSNTERYKRKRELSTIKENDISEDIVETQKIKKIGF